MAIITTIINGVEGKWDENWYKMEGGSLTCPRPYSAKKIADNALDNITSVIEKLGLNYYLREGTCLGFIRTGDYIPWDYDIDVTVIVPSEAALSQLTKEMLQGNKFRLRQIGIGGPEWWKNHHWYWWVEEDKAILIDFKYEYPSPAGKQFYIEYEKGPLDRELNVVSHSGKEYNVPHPVEEYLTKRYGKNWSKPYPYHLGQHMENYTTSPRLRVKNE